MIKIYGKIDSLKQIRSILDERGLSEFKSIGEINAFVRDFDSNVQAIQKKAELQIVQNIEELERKKKELNLQRKAIEDLIETNTNNKIDTLNTAITKQLSKNPPNPAQQILRFVQVGFFRLRKKYIEYRLPKRISKSTIHLAEEIEKIESKLLDFNSNKSSKIDALTTSEISNLNHAKKVFKEINPLIAGAIGENKVVKEIQKLAVDGVLINDFSLKFNPPIYNRKAKDKIYSIQIDHLLATAAGIFILETKNWSKKSIEKLDLRSPVDQITRTGYALFTMVNGKKALRLKSHHWGKKHVPIRSIIAMINHKPEQQFQYVKVKTLKELNGYIEHFDEVLEETEVNSISDFLRQKQQETTHINSDQSKPFSKSKQFFKKKKSINDLYKDKW